MIIIPIFWNVAMYTLWKNVFLGEVENYKNIFNISESLLVKLLNFRNELNIFYDKFREFDDRKLLKQPEWKKIRLLAYESFKELKKLN